MCFVFEPKKTVEEYQQILTDGLRLLDEETYAEENSEMTVEYSLDLHKRITEFGQRYVRDLLMLLYMHEEKHVDLYGPVLGDKIVLSNTHNFIESFGKEYLEMHFGSVPVIGDLFVITKTTTMNGQKFWAIERSDVVGPNDSALNFWMSFDLFDQFFTFLEGA